MNKDSNSYIFIYSATLVVIVATLLSTVAVLLGPRQQSNRDAEKKQDILQAAGITTERDNAGKSFDEHCTTMLLIDSIGNIIDSSDKAFDTELNNELYNKEHGKTYQLPLFVINDNINVIPLYGNGLWGPVWGYLAIATDGNTIIGATFDHKSETPGLGAEITSERFHGQFKGKTLHNERGFTGIKVVKGGASSLPEPERSHAVDAVSGATITSHGVDEMLNKVIKLYMPYFEKQTK